MTLQQTWTQHLAAGSASASSLMLTGLNWIGIAQSVIVGVIVFTITSLLKLLFKKVIGGQE